MVNSASGMKDDLDVKWLHKLAHGNVKLHTLKNVPPRLWRLDVVLNAAMTQRMQQALLTTHAVSAQRLMLKVHREWKGSEQTI